MFCSGNNSQLLSLAVSRRFVSTFYAENKFKLLFKHCVITHKTEPLSVRKLFIEEDVKLLKLGSSLLPSDLFHFPQNQL